ncbi:NAD-dependent epimerase/dehydratase family protein [Pseudotabrizicola alkalilacus]|uniref:NAD-dependent epimerase/dehydratase family protein n=1 Tax=Pseudotabrizicola alkalilacus TaxID=2305252 RepID=UPI001313DA99|nr:NAD(P)-dependent oxidoreductase [Pseudotabrizicola alkalilacus]
MQEIAGQRVLVTGAGGFIGSHVMTTLMQSGAVPIGLVRSLSPVQQDNGFEWVAADLVTDPLDDLLAGLRPNTIIHCAGRTAAPDTDAGREALFAANLTATARLMSAVSRMGHPVRLVIVSSAAIWAPMPPGLVAIDETHPMRPVAAYGVSKAAATLHALAEGDRLDLDLAVAVPFNVIGPGQPRRLVPQAFIEQLRARPAALALSNAAAVRDWIDVRDVATALVALSQPKGPRGLFNIASGNGVSLQDMALALCQIGGWPPVLREDATHGDSGVSRSIGDARRLTAATGWTPQITLEASLRDMITSAP